MCKQIQMRLKGKRVGATEENTHNENDAEDNEKNGEDEKKSILNFIKNPKTGDAIIAYVIIFILALIALLITKKKSDKEENKYFRK